MIVAAVIMTLITTLEICEMKIKYTINHSNITDEGEVSEYVSASLVEWSGGSVEAAALNGRSAQEALGRLVEALCDKDLLTAEDVVAIADSYDKEPKFI